MDRVRPYELRSLAVGSKEGWRGRRTILRLWPSVLRDYRLEGHDFSTAVADELMADPLDPLSAALHRDDARLQHDDARLRPLQQALTGLLQQATGSAIVHVAHLRITVDREGMWMPPTARRGETGGGNATRGYCRGIVCLDIGDSAVNSNFVYFSDPRPGATFAEMPEQFGTGLSSAWEMVPGAVVVFPPFLQRFAPVNGDTVARVYAEFDITGAPSLCQQSLDGKSIPMASADDDAGGQCIVHDAAQPVCDGDRDEFDEFHWDANVKYHWSTPVGIYQLKAGDLAIQTAISVKRMQQEQQSVHKSNKVSGDGFTLPLCFYEQYAGGGTFRQSLLHPGSLYQNPIVAYAAYSGASC